MNQIVRIITGRRWWIAAWRSRIGPVTSMRLRRAAGKGIDRQKRSNRSFHGSARPNFSPRRLSCELLRVASRLRRSHQAIHSQGTFVIAAWGSQRLLVGAVPSLRYESTGRLAHGTGRPTLVGYLRFFLRGLAASREANRSPKPFEWKSRVKKIPRQVADHRRQFLSLPGITAHQHPRCSQRIEVIEGESDQSSRRTSSASIVVPCSEPGDLGRWKCPSRSQLGGGQLPSASRIARRLA